jgi:hypothetical protein
MDWKTVAEKIGRDDHDKWDRKLLAKELVLTDSGALKLLNGHARGAGVCLIGYGDPSAMPET